MIVIVLFGAREVVKMLILLVMEWIVIVIMIVLFVVIKEVKFLILLVMN